MIVVYIVNPSAPSPSSAPLSLKLFTFTFHFITICTFRFESPYALTAFFCYLKPAQLVAIINGKFSLKTRKAYDNLIMDLSHRFYM